MFWSQAKLTHCILSRHCWKKLNAASPRLYTMPASFDTSKIFPLKSDSDGLKTKANNLLKSTSTKPASWWIPLIIALLIALLALSIFSWIFSRDAPVSTYSLVALNDDSIVCRVSLKIFSFASSNFVGKTEKFQNLLISAFYFRLLLTSWNSCYAAALFVNRFSPQTSRTQDIVWTFSVI